MLHISLHFLVPMLFVALFFRKNWLAAYLILIATIAVDLDHLLAIPVYDSGRCSIGFHPLHQLWMIGFYAALSLMTRFRLVGLGLLIHMGLDAIDCQVSSGVWVN